jgi:hypothetical protein
VAHGRPSMGAIPGRIQPLEMFQNLHDNTKLSLEQTNKADRLERKSSILRTQDSNAKETTTPSVKPAFFVQGEVELRIRYRSTPIASSP